MRSPAPGTVLPANTGRTRPAFTPRRGTPYTRVDRNGHVELVGGLSSDAELGSQTLSRLVLMVGVVAVFWLGLEVYRDHAATKALELPHEVETGDAIRGAD